MQRWILWWTFVVVWTVVLEAPVSVPDVLTPGEDLVTTKKMIAKAGHVAVYALWATFTPLVPLERRYRWGLLVFLMAHAWGSEGLQYLLAPICGRTGTLLDVGLDYVGIAIGVVLGWRWWARA